LVSKNALLLARMRFEAIEPEIGGKAAAVFSQPYQIRQNSGVIERKEFALCWRVGPAQTGTPRNLRRC